MTQTEENNETERGSGLARPPCSDSSLSWWRKDALGWPIETFKEQPVKSATRIICQNIRKVLCKPNVPDQVSPHGAAQAQTTKAI